jgi:AsmA protein
MKPSQLPWKWLLFGLLAVLLFGISLIPWLIGDTSRFGDRVAEELSAWAEGKVKFTGPVHVSFFPDVSVRGPLRLNGSARLPFLKSVDVKEAKVSLDLVDLLRGRISIDMLRLQKPRIRLTDGTKLKASPQSLVANLFVGAPLRVLQVRNGRIGLQASPIKALYVQLDAGEETGALSGAGSFAYKGETVRYTVETGSPKAAQDAAALPVTVKLDSTPVKAQIVGTASFANDFQLDGDMQAEIGNLRDFLTWVGFTVPQGESLKGLSLAGPFRLSGGTLSFDDGTFSLDGNKAVGALAVTASPFPRIEGTFAFDRLILDPYLGNNDASSALFDQALLRYFDADLRISGGEIVAGPLNLGKGGFTITAKGGSVTSEIGELELCGGSAEGRVNVELAPRVKEIDLVADLGDIAIEPCLKPLGLGVKLSGAAALKAELSSKGNTFADITRSLDGNLKLDAHDGSLPVDFARLLSTPMPLDANGWSQDGGSSFDQLKAECRLSQGHIWCETLNIELPRETVAGTGDVDLSRKTLDWNFSVAKFGGAARASPAPNGNAPKVSIRGSLSQPLIRRTDRSTVGEGSLPTGALDQQATPH